MASPDADVVATAAAVRTRSGDSDELFAPPDSKKQNTGSTIDPNTMDSSSFIPFDRPAGSKPGDPSDAAPVPPPFQLSDADALSRQSAAARNNIGNVTPLPDIPIPDALVLSLGPAGVAALAPYLSAIVYAGVEQVETRINLHISNTVNNAFAARVDPLHNRLNEVTHMFNEQQAQYAATTAANTASAAANAALLARLEATTAAAEAAVAKAEAAASAASANPGTAASPVQGSAPPDSHSPWSPRFGNEPTSQGRWRAGPPPLHTTPLHYDSFPGPAADFFNPNTSSQQDNWTRQPDPCSLRVSASSVVRKVDLQGYLSTQLFEAGIAKPDFKITGTDEGRSFMVIFPSPAPCTQFLQSQKTTNPGLPPTYKQHFLPDHYFVAAPTAIPPRNTAQPIPIYLNPDKNARTSRLEMLTKRALAIIKNANSSIAANLRPDTRTGRITIFGHTLVKYDVSPNSSVPSWDKALVSKHKINHSAINQAVSEHFPNENEVEWL